MSLTLLQPLDVAGTAAALTPFNVAAADDHYTDQALQSSLILLSAFGVTRLAHVNDQPVAAWDPAEGGHSAAARCRHPGAVRPDHPSTGVCGDRGPRPTAVETPAPAAPAGQVAPAGRIAQAQSQTLTAWTQAGLFADEVWYFDGHTIEYTGTAAIGKTLHGAKHLSVKAVDEYCLFNHLPGLTCYFPTSVPYAQALRQMLVQAQAALPPELCTFGQRIRKLAFDKEGWDAELLTWLSAEQHIIPLTWVKATAPNRALLDGVPAAAFVPAAAGCTVGKDDQEETVQRVADVDLAFAELGLQRVVVLETARGTRLGILTIECPCVWVRPCGRRTPRSPTSGS